MSDFIFTSESVSEGHPDKLCDRISDALVDLYVGSDADARVACEALATTNRVIVAGEVSSQATIDASVIEDVVRGVVKAIGYEQERFHWRDLVFSNYLHAQSADIARGVDGAAQGAGDQGIMFGYACRESDVFMPAAIYYAHKVLRLLAEARHRGELPHLGPDAKSQMSLLYRDGVPLKATSIVVSSQHDESVDSDAVREMVRPFVLAALPQGWMCAEEDFHVNPTGRFVIGGPDGDTGLTGRKIIVDTYGGAAPHGGGAFSGKDASKVDRSAAYMARYLAKNVVASELAQRCTLQLSYAIGVDKPLSLYIDMHDTGKVDEQHVAAALQKLVDLSPRGISTHLNLRKPIFEVTAAYGHFGRKAQDDGHFSWEKTDLVEPLRRAL